MDLSNLQYHPVAEKLVQVLCDKTQNPNPQFFRVLVSYYLAKVSSMMRVKVKTLDRGVIPVNAYAINLATSGAGKGFSTNIIEDTVINQFKERFLDETFLQVADVHLAKLANTRAAKKGTDPDDELLAVKKEFDMLGSLAFSFDSGTPAAVKQMRHKLLMASSGSMNLEIDEIGSNLLGQVDVLNVFLELYDVGKVKPKLVKNTVENTRNEEIDGRTPTNLMLFGTPSKLLDGGKVETEFLAFLDAGYGRRCFFGYSKDAKRGARLSPEDMLDKLMDTATDQFMEDLSDHLGMLADAVNFDKVLTMDRAVSIKMITYKQFCEDRADRFPEHDEIRKAEMNHRYFKVLKLAGAYAFIDGDCEVTEDHYECAMAIAEESGKCLDDILKREKNYVKLARYIASCGREVTHADMVEELPFYKGSQSQRTEMMTLATAWGYKNNIIIKRSYADSIEFLSGESLAETDLSQMVVSYGTHYAYNYLTEGVPFDDLHQMTQADGVHWINHGLIQGLEGNGHRVEENCLPGFNMVVVDVDGGMPLATAKLLLQDYKALYYTTKRHQKDGNGDRYRIVLPINYHLKLDAADFKEFMNNIYEWLPFQVDTGTGQRGKKWMSHDGSHEYTNGKLLDALLFIPKTSKNAERKKVIQDQQSLSNVERWFVSNTGTGNRSNQLVKYALLLVDSGMGLDQVQTNVLALNAKLQDKLEEAEVMSTILRSATKAIHMRELA